MDPNRSMGAVFLEFERRTCKSQQLPRGEEWRKAGVTSNCMAGRGASEEDQESSKHQRNRLRTEL